MSAFARPVHLQQTKHHLRIVDDHGECIAEMDRFAWSSNDRTLQETIECRNFKEGREEAAAGNARQIAQFEEMVALINAALPS